MNKHILTLIAVAGIMITPLMGFAAVDNKPVQPQVQVQKPAFDSSTRMDTRMDPRMDTTTDVNTRTDRDINDQPLRVRVDQNRVVRDGPAIVRDTPTIVRDGPVMVRVREFFRSDPTFVRMSDKVDFIECNDSLIIFGVVDSEKTKADIAAKVKSFEGVRNVQNRLIVK